MEIKTIYGNIEYDDLEHFDIPAKTMAFIEEQKEANELFFQDEIDLTDVPTKFKDDVQVLAEVAIAENKFSEPERAFALSEYLDAKLADIEEVSGTTFSAEGGEYMLLTEDEADEEALERAKSLVEEMGLELFGEDNQEYVVDNFVKTDWFDEAMEESHRSYAEDMQGEDAEDSDIYANRLLEELVNYGVMDEPEYPDEPDEDDFESTEEYDEAFEQWENECSDIKSDLGSDAEDKIYDYVEKRNEEYDNGLEYWIETMGREEAVEQIKKMELLDAEKAAEWIVETDGRGPQLGTYDSGEDSYEVTYKGQDYDFYIYRTQ